MKIKTVGVTTPRERALFRRQHMRLFIQLERRFTNNLKRFFNAQGRRIVRQRKRFITIEETNDAIDEVLAADSAKLTKIFNRHYTSTFTSFDKFLQGGFEDNSKSLVKKQSAVMDFHLTQFILNNAAKKVKIINDTSKQRVVADLREIFEIAETDDVAVSLKDLTDTVASTYKDFSTKRAAVIARTETTTAITEASISSVDSMALDNPSKTWLSDLRGPGISRPNHFNQMNEITIPLNDLFEVPRLDGAGFDAMKGPGDQNAPVGQVANCICILAFNAENINEVENADAS